MSQPPPAPSAPPKLPTRVLFLDTETTGLNPSQHQVIEVAATVFDLVHAAPIDSYATLVYGLSNEAYEINAIPPALLPQAPPAEVAWARVLQMARRCDAIVAHRAEFDRAFSPPDLQAIPWVCSKFDLTFPKTKKLGEHLIHLAVAHGVGVVTAHRAPTDVDILTRLFTRVAEMGVSLPELIARGLRPKKLFYSLAPFEQKDVVKEHGFAWDPDRHGKNWYRAMPPEDVAALPFRVRQVD